MECNLFGEELTRSEELRAKMGRKPTQARGYAWAPGTGPAGETCGSCRFAGRRRRWAKCDNNHAPKHTGGKGTDILLRAPACKYWEAADENKKSVRKSGNSNQAEDRAAEKGTRRKAATQKG